MVCTPRFLPSGCAFYRLAWVLLASLQGKPKLLQMEQQLRELRAEVAEYAVNMKPLERDVRNSWLGLPLRSVRCSNQ